MYNIKKRRKALGLTQKSLAAKAGVSYATVSRLERGLTEPLEITLKAIKEALDGSGLDRR